MQNLYVRFSVASTILEFLVCTEMKSVYTDFIDWLIFSGHQLVFSVHQFLKISVSRYNDFQKLMFTDFIGWLIFSVHQFLKISVSRYTDFQKLVYSDFIHWLLFSEHQFVFSVHQPVFENQCEQIHRFSFYQSYIKLVIG